MPMSQTAQMYGGSSDPTLNSVAVEAVRGANNRGIAQTQVDIANVNKEATLGATRMQTDATMAQTAAQRDIADQRLMSDDKARSLDKYMFEKNIEHSTQMFELKKVQRNAENQGNWEHADELLDKELKFNEIQSLREQLYKSRTDAQMINLMKINQEKGESIYEQSKVMGDAVKSRQQSRNAVFGTKESLREEMAPELKRLVGAVRDDLSDDEVTASSEQLNIKMTKQLNTMTGGRLDYEEVRKNPGIVLSMLKSGDITDTDIAALYMLNEVAVGALSTEYKTRYGEMSEFGKLNVGKNIKTLESGEPRKWWDALATDLSVFGRRYVPFTGDPLPEDRFPTERTIRETISNKETTASKQTYAAKRLMNKLREFNTQLQGIVNNLDPKDTELAKKFYGGRSLANPVVYDMDEVILMIGAENADGLGGLDAMANTATGMQTEALSGLKRLGDSEYAERFMAGAGVDSGLMAEMAQE